MSLSNGNTSPGTVRPRTKKPTKSYNFNTRSNDLPYSVLKKLQSPEPDNELADQLADYLGMRFLKLVYMHKFQQLQLSCSDSKEQ